MAQKKLTLGSNSFVLLASLVFTLMFNTAFFSGLRAALRMDESMDFFVFPALAVMVFCITNLIFCIFLTGFMRKPFLVLFFLLCAASSYFAIYFSVIIDDEMLTNVFETSLNEASRLVTPRLILWMLAFGVLPAVLACWLIRIRPAPFNKAVLRRGVNIMITVLVLTGMYFSISGTFHLIHKAHHTAVKYVTPVNYLVAIRRYIRNIYRAQIPFQPVGEDAVRAPAGAGQKKKLLIFLVGETSRAESFSLNGYKRDTNPLLGARDDVVNFRKTHSCATSTAVSVPCMFSAMPRKNFNGNLARKQDNLLDILQRTGIDIFWRENDDGCKEVCARVPHENILPLHPKEVCPSGLCYDIYLLKDLEKYLDSRNGDTVIVLHTNGSHGPAYRERYPEERIVFSPICQHNDVDNCTREELFNAYDNTIINVDYVLDSTIRLLEKYQDRFASLMIYASDHGESLGEEDYFLHGSPYNMAPDQQIHVPMIYWLSPDFYQDQHIDRACLMQQAANSTFSHDHLFHTVLSAMNVSTSVYEPALDIFAPCRIPDTAVRK